MGSVPASSASHARSGHVCPRMRHQHNIKISASFHHDYRCDSLISDIARDTTRKISFKHKQKIIPPPDGPSRPSH